MKCAVLDFKNNEFSLGGECPHCHRQSVFMMITGAHEQFVENTNYWLLVAGLQCQGCLKYILGIVYKLQGGALNYKEHYPLGKPDDEYPPRFPHP